MASIKFSVKNNGPRNSPNTRVVFDGLQDFHITSVNCSIGTFEYPFWRIGDVSVDTVASIEILGDVIEGRQRASVTAVVSGGVADHVLSNNTVEIAVESGGVTPDPEPVPMVAPYYIRFDYYDDSGFENILVAPANEDHTATPSNQETICTYAYNDSRAYAGNGVFMVKEDDDVLLVFPATDKMGADTHTPQLTIHFADDFPIDISSYYYTTRFVVNYDRTNDQWLVNAMVFVDQDDSGAHHVYQKFATIWYDESTGFDYSITDAVKIGDGAWFASMNSAVMGRIPSTKDSQLIALAGTNSDSDDGLFIIYDGQVHFIEYSVWEARFSTLRTFQTSDTNPDNVYFVQSYTDSCSGILFHHFFVWDRSAGQIVNSVVSEMPLGELSYAGTRDLVNMNMGQAHAKKVGTSVFYNCATLMVVQFDLTSISSPAELTEDLISDRMDVVEFEPVSGYARYWHHTEDAIVVSSGSKATLVFVDGETPSVNIDVAAEASITMEGTPVSYECPVA